MRTTEYANAYAEFCRQREADTEISVSASDGWTKRSAAWRQVAEQHEYFERGAAQTIESPSIVPSALSAAFW